MLSKSFSPNGLHVGAAARSLTLSENSEACRTPWWPGRCLGEGRHKKDRSEVWEPVNVFETKVFRSFLLNKNRVLNSRGY